jgi:hypothetical protein
LENTVDKIAAYELLLSGSDLWDAGDLEKLAASRRDLQDAKHKANTAALLHGAGHVIPGIGLLARIPAGYQQRQALQMADIDYQKGGEGTFGARHPILSGFLPIGGTVSAMNAAGRIDRKLRKKK